MRPGQERTSSELGTPQGQMIVVFSSTPHRRQWIAAIGSANERVYPTSLSKGKRF